MSLTARQKHAREIERLKRKIQVHRHLMVSAWRAVEHDPEVRRLQARLDARRELLSAQAKTLCDNHRRVLLPLENRLKAAQAAHDQLVSAKLVAWLAQMRGRSQARKKWTLAWFSDNERFVLLRRPPTHVKINDTTTHGYGLRHDFYDLGGEPKRVYEFVGRMVKANWELMFQHIRIARQPVKAAP